MLLYGPLQLFYLLFELFIIIIKILQLDPQAFIFLRKNVKFVPFFIRVDFELDFILNGFVHVRLHFLHIFLRFQYFFRGAFQLILGLF